jgi:SNF2-related domain/Helicase conserved C-terminal domain
MRHDHRHHDHDQDNNRHDAKHDPAEQREAYRALLDLAHGKTGKLPAPRLAAHVLALHPDADWPVQRAAMEALLRRVRFAARDELKVSGRPGGRRVLGRYETRRRGSRVRPYTSLVTAVDPLRGSCSCPDYLRGSLGLCKHLLVVLEQIIASPGRLKRALREQERGAFAVHLAWDPVRPLDGPGDWLARVTWLPGAAALPGRPARALEAARAQFAPGADDEDAPWHLTEVHPDDDAARARLASALRAFVRYASRRGGAAATGLIRVDPALPELLEREHRLLRLRKAGGRLAGAVRRRTAGLKLRLYPYQVEGVRRFLQRGRLLLADDMGLGKTIQAVTACHLLLSQGLVRRGLVVVPASLKPQWLREWRLASEAPVTVVDGNPDQRAATYRAQRRGFLIVNYEQLLRDVALVQQWQPEIVVLDEAQRIKNWATKTAACVKQLRPPFRLVLTGTPLENRLEELASIMDWVDDLALEPKWRLNPQHMVAADGEREVSGVRDLGTLRARLAPSMVRRVRQEVLKQLPPRTDTRVPVELTPEQRDEHDLLYQPIARLLAAGRRRPLTRAEFLRLMSLLTTQRIICNGLAQHQFEATWPGLEGGPPTESLLRGLASPKLAELRELVAQVALGQGQKMVVFSQWRRMLQLAHWAVGDLLAGAGARAVFFSGQERQARRTQNLVDFHDDPCVRVLFATDAGGVGLNLQRAATCAVNLELPWNPAVLEQRVGRIYRLGQKRPVQVFHLVCEEGIEARIAELVGNKRALFRGLFDGTSDEVVFSSSGSFLDRVERLMEPAAAGPSPDDAAPDVVAALQDEQDTRDEQEALRAPEPPLAAPVVGSAPPLVVAAASASADPAALLQGIRVERSAGGGITIQAEPAAAATLAAMFEGMARLITASAAAPECEPGTRPEA